MPHSKKNGNGDLTEGLYVLSSSACFDENPRTSNLVSYNSFTNSVFSCQNVVTYKNAYVWHSRFGNVSDKILRLLSNEIPFDMSHIFSTSDCQISPHLLHLIMFPTHYLIFRIVTFGGHMVNLHMMGNDFS